MSQAGEMAWKVVQLPSLPGRGVVGVKAASSFCLAERQGMRVAVRLPAGDIY